MTKSNKKTKVKTTVVESTKIDMTKYNKLPTKSAKIRAMTADGISRSDIAKSLEIRYQHVRNVLETNLKRPVSK